MSLTLSSRELSKTLLVEAEVLPSLFHLDGWANKGRGRRGWLRFLGVSVKTLLCSCPEWILFVTETDHVRSASSTFVMDRRYAARRGRSIGKSSHVRETMTRSHQFPLLLTGTTRTRVRAHRASPRAVAQVPPRSGFDSPYSSALMLCS